MLIDIVLLLLLVFFGGPLFGVFGLMQVEFRVYVVMAGTWRHFNLLFVSTCH